MIKTVLFIISPFIIFYLYRYQKNVKTHIQQNDDMFKMIEEMYKKV
jgi:hypothetical protein